MPTGPHAAAGARRVAELLGIVGEPSRHRDGWSNHVWIYDEAVIRIAAGPEHRMLELEAGLAPRLPAAVGYPRLLGHGVIDSHAWMAQERLPGDNLAGVWDSLAPGQRAFAVADLWARIEALQDTDITGLHLPASPLYAFDRDSIERQLDAARPIVGDGVAAQADAMVRAGLDAAAVVPAALVHTDAVLTNVVWTGSAAIPIDFEFACVGPVDLDADCVGREVVARGDQGAIAALYEALQPILECPGAIDRLRGYAVLRALWAIGKWIEHDPTLTGATRWAPVRELIDHTGRSGWVDRLCS